MSLQQYPKVLQVIDEGYEFELGDYISRGINIFKKNIGGFVGYTALFFLILLVVAFVPILGLFAIYALTPILLGGFYIAAHKLSRDGTMEFRDFFKGFEKAGQLILWYIVMIIAISLVMAPMFISMFAAIFAFSATASPEDLATNPFWMFSIFPAWGLLLLIPVTYLAVSWRWAPMFIVFQEMNFWDAMEASRRTIGKKFWMHLLFSIVLYIFAMLGYLGLLVGILFTVPAVLCMDYAAFADVIKLEQEETLMENIEEHLVG